MRRVSKIYPSVKDGDIDDRASRFIRGGKKRTAISPYDPSFITLLRLSLSLPFGKENGWQCQNVSRHQILAEPAADTIQYRCLLFGCWRRGVRIYTVSYFPLATRQVTHTGTHTIHAVYVDDEMSWPWVAPSLFTCSVLHLPPRRRCCCYAKGKVILEKSRPVLTAQLYATTHPGNI